MVQYIVIEHMTSYDKWIPYHHVTLIECNIYFNLLIFEPQFSQVLELLFVCCHVWTKSTWLKLSMAHENGQKSLSGAPMFKYGTPIKLIVKFNIPVKPRVIFSF